MAFKALFEDPDSIDITIDLLNSILQLAHPIVRLTVLNPIVPGESPHRKSTILDLRAEDDAQRQFHVEMQTTIPPWTRHRAAFYACRSFGRQLKRGDRHRDLKSTISIFLVDGVMYPDLSTWHTRFQLCDASHHVTLTDLLQIHFLELPKCSVPLDNVPAASDEVKWCVFFNRAAGLTVSEVQRAFVRPEIAAAAEKLEEMSKSPQQRMDYESREMFLRDQASRYAYEYETGREQGILIGQILTLRSLLLEPATPAESLQSLSMEDLERQVTELRQRMQQRPSN